MAKHRRTPNPRLRFKPGVKTPHMSSTRSAALYLPKHEPKPSRMPKPRGILAA